MSAMRWIVRALLLAAFAAPAGAQQFPTRPIVLVVPYAAGGNVDVSARALQAGLGDSLGQPVVVENRPGAAGTLTGQYVARAAPDGHTLFVGSNGPIMLDVGFFQLVDTAPHLKAGTLRALAILGATRAPSLPEVPTIGEAGYPDVQGVTFNGVFAPKATPRPVVDKLSAAIRAALAKPEVADRLAALGSTARGSTPEEFAKFLAQETDKWTDVMKRANIKVTE